MRSAAPSSSAVLLAVLLALHSTASHAGAARDPCNPMDTSFVDDQQQAIACYAGNFLVKMLTELNSGSQKTVEHVRIHLLPYLGGASALEAMLTDDLGDASCAICFRSDKDTHDGLLGLRQMLTAQQLEQYDRLDVCYHTLTNRIMARLPQDSRGLYLQPLSSQSTPEDSFEQAMHLLGSLFQAPTPRNSVEAMHFDVRSCRVQTIHPHAGL